MTTWPSFEGDSPTLLAQPDGLAHLLLRPHQGKGAAVQSGLEAATTPLAAFCDLDLSTPTRDLGGQATTAEFGATVREQLAVDGAVAQP